MPEQVGRLAERIDDGRQILKLVLDGVLGRVAAFTAAAPIDGVDGEALLQERLDEAEAEMVAGGTVD